MNKKRNGRGVAALTGAALALSLLAVTAGTVAATGLGNGQRHSITGRSSVVADQQQDDSTPVDDGTKQKAW